MFPSYLTQWKLLKTANTQLYLGAIRLEYLYYFLEQHVKMFYYNTSRRYFDLAIKYFGLYSQYLLLMILI